MTDIKATVERIIDTQNVAFIGSIDAEGFPFKQNNRACIYFCDPDSFQGAMLKGIMEVLTDARHKELIWREGDTEYYKEGVTDPDYCVLKFTAVSGRYYSDFHSENFPID